MVKSFALLFACTFFICLFIFLMQFLWRKVDEIVGKGLSFDILGKFFYESSLMLIPQALPLAILLAALITFGNFGERLELLAMKAAGIPLLRVMAPLVVVVVILSGISFYFQNVTGPEANVRLYTLLFSVKQKSPELEIPEGVFYDEIEGYNLYVKHKNRKTGMLYDVIIYNFSDGFENAHILVADSGRLESTADSRHLYLHLYSGEQFENLKSQEFDKRNVPYRRESFREKHILIEFDSGFSMMDGSFLNKQAASKNMIELSHSADSLSQRMDSVGRSYFNNAVASVYPRIHLSASDSAQLDKKGKATHVDIDSLFRISTRQLQQRWIKWELTRVESQRSDYRFKEQIVYDNNKNINRHWLEWWKKITLSLSCIVFFFIGAPLGAIIRKGGLGMPVIISVFTFIVYYIFDTSGSKMAREGEWFVWFGGWGSTFVLAPIAMFFTYKANNDSMVFNVDAYKETTRLLLGLRTARHISKKEVIIEDPDYVAVDADLATLSADCKKCAHARNFDKIPNYIHIFTMNKSDEEVMHLRDRLEKIIEELGNSRDKQVLNLLNQYPVPAVNAHKSPFSKMWLNLIVGGVLPAGLFFYFRVWRFSRRLDRDLKTIIRVNGEMREVIEKKFLS